VAVKELLLRRRNKLLLQTVKTIKLLLQEEQSSPPPLGPWRFRLRATPERSAYSGKLSAY